MNLDKIRNNDPTVVDDYVRSKFKKFNGLIYSHKTRVKKCIEYYLAAEGSMHGQAKIERIYQDVFHQLFPIEEAENVLAAKAREPRKIESSEWLKNKEEDKKELQEAINQLNFWKETNEWQMGEGFFAQLVTRVEFVDKTLCDQTQFQSEFSAACRAEITSTVAMTDKEIEAKFDLMVGIEQSAACSFEARNVNWGLINGKLEESFKTGLWANGSAKATMERLGFSAEIQGAIAIGAQLNLEGNLKWTKGKGQLALIGEAEAFVGARTQGEMKLSVSALKGLNASISAGAFAGFSATATGSCSFSYDNNPIATVEATAGVTFGIGAEFAASIKAPIFGPTAISFATNLTFALGTEFETKAEIDFNAASLAASDGFRKVVYWRTMAQGYKITLMNSDAKNLYYLNKSISRLTEELESISSTIESFEKIPMEKRSLLM